MNNEFGIKISDSQRLIPDLLSDAFIHLSNNLQIYKKYFITRLSMWMTLSRILTLSGLSLPVLA